MKLLVTILPTPVSALIHAATLVTAGVYLLLRSSPVIEYGPTTLIVITWVGALTAFFAASTGLLQNDLKRVIAYSTCSQMGYLFMACGLSAYDTALFHLVNHAFFKALLFLAAGAVLHATYDQQDQRRLGGLIGFLPFTYTAILIGSLSLMALPWLTGFYSKDIIIELAYGQYEFSGIVAYWLGTISAGLTAFYSLRLISLTFFTYPNAPKSVYNNVHDAPTIVMIPLAILSILAIFFGYIASDLFVGIGSDFLSQSLFTHPSHITLVEAENIALLPKLLPIILSIVGAGAALYFYHVLPTVLISITDTQVGNKLYKFLNGKYYIDVLYNHYIINGALKLGYTISKVLDRGIIELVGPHGLTTGFTSASKNVAKLDTGNLTSYALYIAISVVVLLFVLFSSALIQGFVFDTRIVFVLITAILSLPMITKNNNSITPLSFSNIIIVIGIVLFSVTFPAVLIYLIYLVYELIKSNVVIYLVMYGLQLYLVIYLVSSFFKNNKYITILGYIYKYKYLFMFVYMIAITKILIYFCNDLGISNIYIPFWSGEAVYNTMYSNVVPINSNIKFEETKYTIEAKKVLKQMIDSLEGEELEFSKKHLVPLLKPLNGDTPFGIDYMEKHNINTRCQTIKLDGSTSLSMFAKQYDGMNCIYSFHTEDCTMETTYIGQTQNVMNRLYKHLEDSTKQNTSRFHKFLAENKENIFFSINIAIPKFDKLWFKDHSTISPNFLTILKAFNEYQLGIYEQSLFTYYKPSLNTNLVSKFLFLNYTASDNENLMNYLGSEKSLNVISLISDYKTEFDFTLYYDICASRNSISKVDDKWLEWFIGYTEQRGNFNVYYKRKSFTFYSNSVEFLTYIKDSLNLEGPIITRESNKSMLYLYSVHDWEIISAILYKNMVSSSLNDGFVDYFINAFPNVFKENTNINSSIISLDNHWLSGYFDGAISFYYKLKPDYVPCVEITIGDKTLFAILTALFVRCRVVHNKRLKFEGQASVVELLEYLDKYPLKSNYKTQCWMKDTIQFQKELRASVKRGIPYTLQQKQSVLDRIKSRPTLSPFPTGRSPLLRKKVRRSDSNKY